MKYNESSKIRERRKKRMFIPTFYFLAEVVFAWLVLSIIQVDFDLRSWSMWSVIVFTVALIYSLAKTIHVYKRQRNYKE